LLGASSEKAPSATAPSATPGATAQSEKASAAPRTEAAPSDETPAASWRGALEGTFDTVSVGGAGGAAGSCVALVLRRSPKWIQTPLGVAFAVAQLWRIVTAPGWDQKAGRAAGAASAAGAAAARYALDARIGSMLETLRASGAEMHAIVDAIPRSIVNYVLAAAIASRSDGSTDALLNALHLTRTGFLAGLLHCMLRSDGKETVVS
jgi:hypothetical protein